MKNELIGVCFMKPGVTGWQPIETAPTEQWVLVYYDKKLTGHDIGVGIAAKFSVADCWQDWDPDFTGEPEFWMPLPAPPEQLRDAP